MILRDKAGWPVETIKGRAVTNFLRLIIHTSIRETWKRRNSPTKQGEKAKICIPR